MNRVGITMTQWNTRQVKLLLLRMLHSYCLRFMLVADRSVRLFFFLLLSSSNLGIEKNSELVGNQQPTTQNKQLSLSLFVSIRSVCRSCSLVALHFAKHSIHVCAKERGWVCEYSPSYELCMAIAWFHFFMCVLRSVCLSVCVCFISFNFASVCVSVDLSIYETFNY